MCGVIGEEMKSVEAWESNEATTKVSHEDLEILNEPIDSAY